MSKGSAKVTFRFLLALARAAFLTSLAWQGLVPMFFYGSHCRLVYKASRMGAKCRD